MTNTLTSLRRFAVTRSLFPPTTLAAAIERLGFVQADPIRAPARAQDLTLRQRSLDYRAGELERCYADLDVEEGFFINYGFLAGAVHRLMYPRPLMVGWSAREKKRAQALLAFIRERGHVHPRDVDAHFAHGLTTNYWGGNSKATTYLLEHMHYDGLVRVARRERGVRIYTWRDREDLVIDRAARDRRIDALVDVVVSKYAPVPAPSLSMLVSRLRYAVPHWRGALKAALTRARGRLERARVNDVDWFWPAGERPQSDGVADAVRLLTPFDPVVWDRKRFEMFWDWQYRFEAYTPAAKRKLGYYAMPILWRDLVVGWANVAMKGDSLAVATGYVAGRRPRERAFARELDTELDRMRRFLGGSGGSGG